MSDYLSLIANLNSESPVISSPEDYSAELSLWTNAEFTFDMPPGLGIFEQDSGFGTLSSMNHPSHQGLAPVAAPQPETAPVAAQPAKATVGHNPQSALDQQHLMEYLNLPQEGKARMSSTRSAPSAPYFPFLYWIINDQKIKRERQKNPF